MLYEVITDVPAIRLYQMGPELQRHFEGRVDVQCPLNRHIATLVLRGVIQFAITRMSGPGIVQGVRAFRITSYNVCYTKLLRSAYFISPIAYIVISVFLLVTGWFFFATFFLFNQANLRTFYALLPVVFAFVIPAITMRLISEELNIGVITSYSIHYTKLYEIHPHIQQAGQGLRGIICVQGR